MIVLELERFCRNATKNVVQKNRIVRRTSSIHRRMKRNDIGKKSYSGAAATTTHIGSNSLTSYRKVFERSNVNGKRVFQFSNGSKRCFTSLKDKSKMTEEEIEAHVLKLHKERMQKRAAQATATSTTLFRIANPELYLDPKSLNTWRIVGVTWIIMGGIFGYLYYIL